MMSFFKRYLPFTRGAMSSVMAYRVSAVLWLLAEALKVVVMYFIWRAVFVSSGQETLKGFTLNAMLIYLLSQRIIFSLTFMQPLWDVSDDYRQGRIAMSLIKPINYRTSLFFGQLGANLTGTLIFAVPYLVFMIFITLVMDVTLTFTIPQVLILIVSILFGMMISFLVNMLYANIVFYTTGSFGIFQMNEVITKIFSGELIPLVFFPAWLLKIAKFLPFMHVQYVPILIFMNRMTRGEMFEALGLQLLWIVILLILGQLLWKNSMKRLVVMGG